MRKISDSFKFGKISLLAATVLTMMVFTIQTADADYFTFMEHGIRAQVENPANVLATKRIGWGTILTGKPNTGTWVHIPISAHYSVGGGNYPYIYGINLKFNTEFGYPTIKSVHIRSGRSDMKLQLDGLDLSGDYLTNPWSYTFKEFYVGQPVSLSFYVDFGPQVGGKNPRFHILGVRFEADRISP
jgi:hypothetical protein